VLDGPVDAMGSDSSQLEAKFRELTRG